MKKLNDVVTYTIAGVSHNALVVNSRGSEEDESLDIIYLDSALLMLTKGQPTTAFSVPPMKEGAARGWSEPADNGGTIHITPPDKDGDPVQG